MDTPPTVPTGISGVVVTAAEASTTINQKLVAAIQVVWGRLPQAMTQQLMSHWQQNRQQHGESLPIPLITTGKVLDTPGQYGASTEGIAYFFFCEIACDKLPAEHLETLVAHEFVHGYRNAGKTVLKDSKAEEDEVRRITESLGFDQKALTQALKCL